MPSYDIVATKSPDVTPYGRMAKYNAKLHDDLVKAFRMGTTIEMACYYAGISVGTFHRWRKAVENKDLNDDLIEEKTKLFDDIAKARAELQYYHLQQIEGAAITEWRAAAWKLERVFKADFSPHGTLDLETTNAPAINEVVHETFDLTKLSDEQLEQVMGILDGVKTTVIEVIGGSENGDDISGAS